MSDYKSTIPGRPVMEGTTPTPPPTDWTPALVSPTMWYRSDSISTSGSDVLGFIDKSGNAINANFSGAAGALLPNAVSNKPSVNFNPAQIAYVGSFNDHTKYIDRSTPFSTFGVVSACNWYLSGGGTGYCQFWQLNDGLTTCGLNFTTQDPVPWPGYTGYLVFAGDGITTYIGGNGLDNRYDQYFSFLINYAGGGDFGDPTKWEIYFNSVSDPIITSPPYADVVPNVPNLVSVSGPLSVNSAWVEFGFVQGATIVGANKAGLFAYNAERYGL